MRTATSRTIVDADGVDGALFDLGIVAAPARALALDVSVVDAVVVPDDVVAMATTTTTVVVATASVVAVVGGR